MDIQNIINIIAIVLSPIIAVLITRYLSIRTDKKKDKMEIFKILMATRYNRCTIEYVRALNSIDVVFYDSKKVRKAWSDYYSVLQNPTPNSNLISDKELLLIEAMAQDLHYTNIKWENVKSFYFPQWLSTQYQQEANFKNAQLTITSSISQSLSESGMKNDNKQEKKFE